MQEFSPPREEGQVGVAWERPGPRQPSGPLSPLEGRWLRGLRDRPHPPHWAARTCSQCRQTGFEKEPVGVSQDALLSPPVSRLDTPGCSRGRLRACQAWLHGV